VARVDDAEPVAFAIGEDGLVDEVEVDPSISLTSGATRSTNPR